ncbi:pectate lyase [Opitutales bacterium ASA1]|uniref:pectate lyase n=1 Tax=Congregicoccus parvus TaxID=3081749 RepID=UPI002B2C6EB8|nr:pectate lyase [Opitutales bacterium ASA1]
MPLTSARFGRTSVALGFLVLPLLVSARASESPSAAQVHDALARASAAMRSIAVHGGYVWRISEDGRSRFGENPTTATQIWVQPPGTPAVGSAFLRMYEATGDTVHLDAARDAALALVHGQLESGGWDYLVEFDPELRSRWAYRADGAVAETTREGRRNLSTYDDDNTQSVIRFLVRFCVAAASHPDPRDAQIADARDYALRKLIEAQYPNGAWPQRWSGTPHDPKRLPVVPASFPEAYPREHPQTTYYSHYTLNDATHRDCVRTLLEAHRLTGVAAYREAAHRGADFLLLAQLPAPQSAWAQQYDAAMHPAWARAFEPPAVCTSESGGVLTLLLEMYSEFGDTRYLDAAKAALPWFERVRLGPDRWARLYEIGTDRPIYGDRDGRIHYSLGEISEERRTGYSWEGSYNLPTVLRRVAGAPASLSTESPRRNASSDREAASVLASQHADGSWKGPARAGTSSTETAWISSLQFVRNVETLCAWLEASRTDREPDHT